MDVGGVACEGKWRLSSQTRMGERSWGPKTRNQVRQLSFRSVVLNSDGGGLVYVDGIAHEGKWRSWGCAFTNMNEGEGLGVKSTKPSVTARFRVCCAK